MDTDWTGTTRTTFSYAIGGHNSSACECCQDFWGAAVPQTSEKEQTESDDADSGYGSIVVQRKQTPPPILQVPKIIVTPLTDDEQLRHNACIREALILRNAFSPYYYSSSSPSSSITSLDTVTMEDKACPTTTDDSSPLSLVAAALKSRSTTSLFGGSPSLRPPEEAWSHRIKDTYENRLAYPQFFEPFFPPTSESTSTSTCSLTTSSSSTSSTSPSSSGTSLYSLGSRTRASKDSIELHPAAMPRPAALKKNGGASVVRRQALKKRWSIGGSGMGLSSFGFGHSTTSSSSSTSTSPSSTPPASTPSTPSTRPKSLVGAPEDESKAQPAAASTRRRTNSSKSLTSSLSCKSPNAMDTALQPVQASSARNASLFVPQNSNTGPSSSSSSSFGRGLRSLVERYSTAPSSFRL